MLEVRGEVTGPSCESADTPLTFLVSTGPHYKYSLKGLSPDPGKF